MSAVDVVKMYTELLNKLDKDFSYLKNPSVLPTAYEKAITEIKRRRKFRKVLDEKYDKLHKLISTEKQARDVFISEYGKYLPSEFVP